MFMWRSEDNLGDLVLSLHNVGPKEGIDLSYQIWQQPPLSPLAGPFFP